MKIKVIEKGLLENLKNVELDAFVIEDAMLNSVKGGTEPCFIEACGAKGCAVNISVIEPTPIEPIRRTNP